MSLQKKILEVRTKQGLTQDELAEKLSVTRQAVSRWENGETTPSLETLKSFAELFKVDICELIGIGAECQSCSWALKELDVLGSNSDKSVNFDYCGHCHNQGKFSAEKNASELVEVILTALDMYNEAKGTKYTAEEARVFLNEHLATLKRWKK